LTRRRFGFQGWMDFDVRLWTALRDEARQGVQKHLAAPILGSDLRRDAVAHAQNNARAAGIGHLVRFEVKDVRHFQPPPGPPGVILCNPPYGERIGDEKELKNLYRALGAVLRQRCAGWSAFVFTGNPVLARYLELAPLRDIPLFNGKIPCRLLQFELPRS
jgi:putative N6-adenine-specific DNA methylase